LISPHCARILEDFENPARRKDICTDFRQIRAVVMCEAWRIMESEHVSFKESISRAWAWARTKCSEAGAYI